MGQNQGTRNKARQWFALAGAAVLSLMMAGSAQAKTFNVMDYGATADGFTDDHTAVLAAMSAANKVPGIDKIYFPAGSYMIGNGSSYISTDAVVSAGFVPGDWIFEGAGRDQTILKAGAKTADGRIFRFISAKNITIRNMAFDHNGAVQFGGVLFYNTENTTVENTRYFDSHMSSRAAQVGNDIDSFLWGRAGGHRNVVFRNNLIEDCQVDFSSIYNGVVENNTINRAWGTAAIGVYSAQDTVADEELVVLDGFRISSNTIVGLSSVTVGIAIHIDPAIVGATPLKYQKYRNIKVVDNTIYHSTGSLRTGYAIKVGQTDNSKQTIGFTFDNIEIARNRIFVSSGITFTGSGIIQLMTSRPSTPDFRFTNTRVYDNELYMTGSPTFIEMSPVNNRQFPPWDGVTR